MTHATDTDRAASLAALVSAELCEVTRAGDVEVHATARGVRIVCHAGAPAFWLAEVAHAAAARLGLPAWCVEVVEAD
jgi:hypothetical protein